MTSPTQSPGAPSPNLESSSSSPSRSSSHEPADQSPIPIPNNPSFQPFFPLLTATTSPTLSSEKPHWQHTTTTTTRHPHTYYIFATDTPETSPLTTAALHALTPSLSTSSSASPPSSPQPPSNPANRQTGGSNDDTHPISFHPRRNERFILIDLDTTGTKVLSARSLSPEFAVTGTSVSAAPTWENGSGGGGGAGGKGGGGHGEHDSEEGRARRERGMKGAAAKRDGGDGVIGDEEEEDEGLEKKTLMLKVEGIEIGDAGRGMEPKTGGDGQRGEGKGGSRGRRGGEMVGTSSTKSLEDLRAEFEEGMRVLRKVVDANATINIENEMAATAAQT